jgi:hypothetical protein
MAYPNVKPQKDANSNMRLFKREVEKNSLFGLIIQGTDGPRAEIGS